MFYLTVLLPASIVTIIYSIMLFTHARTRGVGFCRVLLYNLAFLFAIIFVQISVYFAVENFRVNELLSGCFFQLFLHVIVGIALGVLYGITDTDKTEKESEKARLFIRNLTEEKKTDLTLKSESEKVDNGAILQHREGENSTKGGFCVGGAEELTLTAKKKSSSSVDMENTLKAEHVLSMVKNGGKVPKREIENAVDSLIKIVSSKKWVQAVFRSK